MKRRTLSRPVKLSGRAVRYNDRPLTLIIEPGTDGLAFRRTDLGERYPATLASVVPAPNCTALGRDGRPELVFVEHVLSALAGLGYTDAEVSVDGPEVPLFDGSAAPLVSALAAAGVSELPSEVEPIRLQQPVWLVADGRCAVAMPACEWSVDYTFEHPHPVLAHDHFGYGVDSDYARDLAPARTFATVAEIEMLRAKGLLHGGSESDVLLVREDGFASPLRLPNEVAAHKVIDLTGDLALLGRPLVARVLAYRTGHADNHALARKILRTQEYSPTEG